MQVDIAKRRSRKGMENIYKCQSCQWD